ncbi:MAG: hypothetical protein J6U87_06695 [Clostridia bacterium]|nr:hypothetical protein [Clostridia bacterium]
MSKKNVTPRTVRNSPTKKAPKGTLLRVLSYLRGYRSYLFISLVLAVSSVALTLWLPILIGDAIDCIVAPGAVDFSSIRAIFAKAVIAIGTTAIFQWLMNVCNNKMTFGVARNIRNDAFRHLQKTPLSYLDSRKTGDVVSRMIADVDQFTDGLLLGFTQLFSGVITIVGTLMVITPENSCVKPSRRPSANTSTSATMRETVSPLGWVSK